MVTFTKGKCREVQEQAPFTLTNLVGGPGTNLLTLKMQRGLGTGSRLKPYLLTAGFKRN